MCKLSEQEEKRGMLVLTLSLVLAFLVGMNNPCFCEGLGIWDNDTSSWITNFAGGDPIDAATGNPAYLPQIAVDSNGIVYAVFYQNDGTYQRIYLTRYDGTDVKIWDNDTSSWITTFTGGDPIDATGSAANNPQIAVDSSGRVYVVYQQPDEETNRIYLSRYDGTDVKIWSNGGWTDTFGNGNPIDAATGDAADAPQIAVDSNGVVYVTYEQSDGEANRIYLSRYDGTDVEIWDTGISDWTDTLGNGDPIDVTGNNASEPQIAVDSSGRVYVVYYQWAGFEEFYVYLNRYDGDKVETWDNDTSSWTDTFTEGDPINIVSSEINKPQIAVDSSGRVYVTYYQAHGGTDRIFLNRYDGDKVEIWDNDTSSWTDTFNNGDPIDAATGNAANNPQLAVDSSGRVYVVYGQVLGGIWRIYLSRYDGEDVKIWSSGGWTDTFSNGDPIDPGTQSCGAPQLAVDLNGNVYITYSHVLIASTYLNRYDGTDVRIWDNDTADWVSNFANGDSIDPGDGYAGGPQIAVDLSGRVYVTYMYGQIPQGSRAEIYYRIYLDRYVPPEPVISGDDGEDETPHCFLETAFLGPTTADEIIVFRQFRDERLLTNPLGKVFVAAYYKTSPVLVAVINKYPVLKSILREVLKPVIWLLEK